MYCNFESANANLPQHLQDKINTIITPAHQGSKGKKRATKSQRKKKTYSTRYISLHYTEQHLELVKFSPSCCSL